MSDDLISRKVLMENAKSYFISPDGALRLIESQPTAYDVDKVIEQIDDIMEDESIRFCNQAVNVAKKIVKHGGVSDE